MFHKSSIRQSGLALALAMMLLFSGSLLPGAAPAVYAQAFDVLLWVTSPSLAQPGQNLTYTFRVENQSGTTFTNFAFFNDLPANVTYVSGGTLITDNGAPYVQFTLPTLAAHSTQTVSWVAKANSNLAIGSFIVNESIGPIDSTPAANMGINGSFNTKIEAPGTLVAVYKNASGTPFNVNVHGFHFENYGNEGIPNPNDDLAAADVFELFGPAACQSGTTAATCVLSGPAQSWLTKAIGSTKGGHCDGMAATSLRLFNNLPFRQYSTPASFQAGAANTINLNFPAQPIENYITRYFHTQSYIWDSHFVGTPVETVQKLTADFQKNPSVGYTIAFFLTKNLAQFDWSDWTQGHAVTAYGIETVSPTESRILVYDNNFPNERKYFTVNMAANTWRYVTAANPGQPENAYEGSAFSQNLRLVPLSARDLPAGQYFPCPFCPGATIASADAGAPDLFSGKIDFEYTGEGAILVVNDAGQKTGNDVGNEAFVNEIPDTEIFHFQGGLGQAIPPRISVPYTETDETLYTVMVHGTTVDTPTHGSLSIVGAGFHMGVENIELSPGEVFDLRVSPDGDHISFWASLTATETITAPAMHIAHDPIHAGDPSVIFEVSGETLVAGERISLTLDPVHEHIYIEDEGIEAEEFDITMDLIFPDGDVHVYTDTVIVPVGSTSAFVDFGAWDGRLSPPTYIDNVLQNSAVNHRLKLTSSTGIYDPTPQANAPAGVYQVTATFENVTEVSLQNVYFTVGNLGAGNLLLNADGSPTGVGAKLSVPAATLGDDGILHTHDTFSFSFAVGLASADLSPLTVDANGVPHDWIHPNPAPAYDANNASFSFALSTSQSIFLPIVTR